MIDGLGMVGKMKLYHATTQKKAKQYRQSGAIHAPVRGFTTMQAAMAWAMKVGRVVILEFEADKPHKLPDHHNVFGEAWWNDGDVAEYPLLLRSECGALALLAGAHCITPVFAFNTARFCDTAFGR